MIMQLKWHGFLLELKFEFQMWACPVCIRRSLNPTSDPKLYMFLVEKEGQSGTRSIFSWSDLIMEYQFSNFCGFKGCWNSCMEYVRHTLNEYHFSWSISTYPTDRHCVDINGKVVQSIVFKILTQNNEATSRGNSIYYVFFFCRWELTSEASLFHHQLHLR